MTRLLLALALAACGAPKPPPATPPTPPTTQTPPVQQPEQPPVAKPQDSIGVATMLADGTIQLQLRAEGEGGMVGEALLSYPPTHAKYQYILDHLKPLQPGDSKPVPPFRD
jgi:hypothetical protein